VGGGVPVGDDLDDVRVVLEALLDFYLLVHHRTDDRIAPVLFYHFKSPAMLGLVLYDEDVTDRSFTDLSANFVADSLDLYDVL